MVAAVFIEDLAGLEDREASPLNTNRTLTPRERECLVLVARGKSDWAIGRILGISERTVHNLVERAKRRLGVSGRTQAVVRALSER